MKRRALFATLTLGALSSFATLRPCVCPDTDQVRPDWRFRGPAAPHFVALDKGYYKAEGLDVTIDTGNGSTEAINRAASGRVSVRVWRHQHAGALS